MAKNINLRKHYYEKWLQYTYGKKNIKEYVIALMLDFILHYCCTCNIAKKTKGSFKILQNYAAISCIFKSSFNYL